MCYLEERIRRLGRRELVEAWWMIVLKRLQSQGKMEGLIGSVSVMGAETEKVSAVP